MKSKVWKAFITLPVIFVLMFGGCGGGSNGSGGGPGTPSAGEYLWEFSLIDQNLYFATVNSSTGQLGVPTASGGEACNSNGTIPTIAVTPSNKYAFVIDNCFSQINTYVISGPSISLGIAQAPLSALGDVESVAIDPKGRYLYAISTNPSALYQFGINSSSGELTLLSTVMESAEIRIVVADANGKFIYVSANDETAGHILAYLVNGGSLSPISGSPFTIPSSGQPIYLTMESSGKFLYAPLLSGGIAGFSIDSSTGALSDIPGSPFDTGNLPFTLTSDPLGRFLYAIDTNLTSVEGFNIDATTGALTLIAGSPFNFTSPVNSVAVDPSGNFLYASVNAATLPDSMILGFTIDGSSGSISPLATSPYPAPSFPTNVVSLNVR